MMSLQSKLRTFAEQVAPVSENVYHYWRTNVRAPYVIWQETSGGNDFHADNKKQEQSVICTCDCFTHNEFDQLLDDVQEVLQNHANGWRLLSVQYEEDTNLIHYEWEFEL